jgi:hypothetical protein
MLYREIIAVCSEIHTKHINTLCGQNGESVSVKPGGTYSNHRALEGERDFYHCPHVVVTWIVILFGMWELQGSAVGLGTGCIECNVWDVVPAGKHLTRNVLGE